MSIVKFLNSKGRSDNSLKRAVKYILDNNKTEEHLIRYHGVSHTEPAEDMHTMHFLFDKMEGRKYIHFVLSFDKGVESTIVFKIATEVANFWADDHQYVLAVHTNTENRHAHVILNALNLRTGKKFSQSKKELFQFRDFINEILQEFHLTPIGKSESHNSSNDFWESVETFGSHLSTYWNADDNLDDDFDDEDDDEYLESVSSKNSSRGVFFCDPEEVKLIKEAEEYENFLKESLDYFLGRSDFCPAGYDEEETEMHYLRMKDEEEAYNDYFF